MGNSRSTPTNEDIRRLEEVSDKVHDLKESMEKQAVMEKQTGAIAPGAMPLVQGQIIYIVVGPTDITGPTRTVFDPSRKYGQTTTQFPRVFARLDDAIAYANGIIETNGPIDVRIIKDRIMHEW